MQADSKKRIVKLIRNRSRYGRERRCASGGDEGLAISAAESFIFVRKIQRQKKRAALSFSAARNLK
jgi:hypothetical protein